MFPWIQHHAGPEGAFSHESDGGAAAAASGPVGGRIHEVTHHQTVRWLPVPHQRHHVTPPCVCVCDCLQTDDPPVLELDCRDDEPLSVCLLLIFILLFQFLLLSICQLNLFVVSSSLLWKNFLFVLFGFCSPPLLFPLLLFPYLGTCP